MTDGVSALVVPVPWSEPVVGRWRARYDPSAAAGMPAHITILYPFVPARDVDEALEDEVAVIARTVLPFRLRLGAVGRWPDVIYLIPDPAAPFIRLTEQAQERWPEFPPYGGSVDEIVPHLTVATGEEPPGLVSELERRLPLEGDADELRLAVQDPSRRWLTRRRFPLGE